MNELVGASPTTLARSGAELVELSERFYRGIIASCLLFVGISAAAALALLQMRGTTASWSTPTVWLAAALVAAAPLAVLHVQAVYRELRRSRTTRVALVAIAAAMLAYPLRSELWWPACAVLMLLATLTPYRELAGYCLGVLLINLGAHVIAGDLGDIRAVTIVGLWVGFGFWPTAFALIPDRLAAHVLALNARTLPGPLSSEERHRVDAVTIVSGHRPSRSTARDASVSELQALTARQLQVVALLVDGLRYAEIAACLSISERQVRRLVKQAIRRAGVTNANALSAWARRAGIASSRPPADPSMRPPSADS